MADETQVAESQTATAVEEPQASDNATPQIPDPKDMSPEELQDWNSNPKWADKYFKKSKSDASQESSPDENTEGAEPPAEQVQKKSKTADDRKVQLKGEIEELARKRKAEKEAFERETAEYEAKRTERAASKPGVNTAPPAETKGKPTDGRPIAPTPADFDTYEDFKAAEYKYVEDLTEWKSEQKTAQMEARKSYADKWMPKVNEAMAEFSDWAEVVPPLAKAGLLSKVVNEYLEETPHAAKILYRFGENAMAEAERISKLSPVKQLLETVKLEQEFLTTPKAAEPGKTPRYSRAPAPTRNLAPDSAHGDAITAAASAGNQEEYEALMNAEEAKRRSRR